MKEIKKEITINSSINSILEIGTVIHDPSKTSYFINLGEIDYPKKSVFLRQIRFSNIL